MRKATTTQSINNSRNRKGAAVLIFGLALVVSALPLEAGVLSGCLIDETTAAGTAIDGCTANDIGVNDIVFTSVTDGCISTSDTATVTIDLILNAAQPTRYDVGMFIGLDGGDAVATGGSCFHEALFPVLIQGAVPTAIEMDSGIGGFLNSDGDSCGEVNNGNSYRRRLVDSDVIGASETAVELVIACVDLIDEFGNATPNGYADIGWVVSWYQNAGGVVCSEVAHALPGSPSKCQAGRTDSLNSTDIKIGIANLGLTLVCSPDTIGPGDYVDCTLTYDNPSIHNADYIEYRIDFPDSGTVSMISTNGTDSTMELIGDTDGTGGTTEYIQLVPEDTAVTHIPTLANVPAATTTQTMTFRFTSSASTPDGSTFDITAYTWFNDGTKETYQSQFARDTTGVTPAVISTFATHRHRGQTLIKWETAAETGTAGFYLERKDPATGQWVRVNEGLLPALLERPGGGTYAFLDTAAKPINTQTYRLIAIDITGKREIHGPYVRSASRSSGLENFDAKQSKGFARTAHRPSTAEVAAWDSNRDARLDELSRVISGKGLAPAGTAALDARIRTDGEGLFTLSAATLADNFGMRMKDVQKALRKGTLRLSHQGSPVTYLPSNDLDQLFFFGQAIDSRFTDENTYWATFEKRPGLGSVNLMDEIDGFVPATVTTPQTFLSTTTVEEDVFLAPIAVQNPDDDFWFGGYVSTGYYGNTTYVTEIPAPDAAATGQAEIRLELNGLTNLTAGNDHHAEVRLNGALIGEAVWDGVTPHTLVATFDQSILHDGGNNLEVNGVLDGEVEQSSFLIDTVDLSYQRQYRALNDALIFGSNGHSAITVDGFSGADIEVFDLGNTLQPVHVTATRVENSGAGYQMTFAPSSSDGRYLAVRRAVAGTPSLEIDRPSNLRSPKNAAEYVVIAPASMQRGAQTLVDYRRQRFPDARLIDLQDVYDEFNAGIEDPEAIRTFLKLALGSWQTAPRFAVLAGKGTMDPKDILGFGTNVLPLVMTSTPHGLFASDSRLADVVGRDGVPDIAIGRIPALSSADLQTYVDKLRIYESAGSQGVQTALMLADDRDGAGNFPADSQNVAANLPADVTPIHIAHQTGSAAALTRQQVLDALDEGVMLFNYIGHGGPTQLGSEAFWAVPDIIALDNSFLPIFAAFTCYAGNGTIPGRNSLTEEMTLVGNGGVIASLAPTGLSVNNRAVILNEAFIEALFAGNQTIGEATQSAIEILHQQGGPQFMQEIYNIIGDPAVQVNR